MVKKNQGTTKRFGVRYGRTVKHKLGKIESLAKNKYKCPYCGSVSVKRKSAGIWECKKCKKVFTNKAYFVDKKIS